MPRAQFRVDQPVLHDWPGWDMEGLSLAGTAEADDLMPGDWIGRRTSFFDLVLKAVRPHAQLRVDQVVIDARLRFRVEAVSLAGTTEIDVPMQPEWIGRGASLYDRDDEADVPLAQFRVYLVAMNAQLRCRMWGVFLADRAYIDDLTLVFAEHSLAGSHAQI